LKIFYEPFRNATHVGTNSSLGIAATFYAPFAIIGFAFGLSLQPDLKKLVRSILPLLLLELIPVFVLLLTTIDNPCLQRPGFQRTACALNAQDAENIKSITVSYLVSLPLLLSAISAFLGGYLSYLDRTPFINRSNPVLRIFFVISGLIISLVGLGGIFDQKLSTVTRYTHQIVHLEGILAFILGLVFFSIGLSLCVAGILHHSPIWIIKIWPPR